MKYTNEMSEHQRLKIARRGKNLSLEDVANKTFVSLAQISRIENGERTAPDHLKALLFESSNEGLVWYDLIVQGLNKLLDDEVISNYRAQFVISIVNNLIGL